MYTACTDVGSERNFWCSTKVDDEWNHLTGNWKRCEPMCYKGNDIYTTCTVYSIISLQQIRIISLNSYESLIELEKLPWKSCDSDAYGSYSTIEKARSACISDSACQGVYDSKCDDVGTFKLCPRAAALTESSPSWASCVYSKGNN